MATTGRKARDARYSAANRARIAARAAEWNRDHSERVRQNHAAYRKQNPEKVHARIRNRKALKRGAAGSHTGEQIAALAVAQNHACAACQRPFDGTPDIDHIMPLARGGSNDIGNIQLLCPTCNRRKHAKHPDDWAKEVAAWQR